RPLRRRGRGPLPGQSARTRPRRPRRLAPPWESLSMSTPLPSSVVTEPWVPPTASLVEMAAGTAAGAWAAVGAPVLVRLVRRGLSPLGVSRDPDLTRLNGAAADGRGDPGWFGPDSVAWRVHADTSMLVAGMTAF